jgi:hypothetical protein
MSATREISVVWMVFALMAVGVVGFPAQAKYSGGDGTAKDPWRIASKKDLLALAAQPKDYGSHFVLTAGIDLSKQPFTLAVIASCPHVGHQGEFVGTPFSGTFDGNGHKITNLTIDASRSEGYMGLFGCIGRGGLVENLLLERGSIVGSSIAGMLVGLNDGGTIINCSVAGDITSSAQVGALAGINGAGGTISRCQTVTGTTKGGPDVGGLVGRNASGAKIMDCSAGGNVDGHPGCVGGLVGWNEGTITRCKTTGAVSNSDLAPGCCGGLVGWNEGVILHCQSISSVAGQGIGDSLGGLVANNYPRGVIIDCRATGNVAGGFGAWFGGLAGSNSGLVTHCEAAGDVTGSLPPSGGVVGRNVGIIACSYATGNVTGKNGFFAGGFAGENTPEGAIINCYATGAIDMLLTVGGLTGVNDGAITNCYAVGKVTSDGSGSRAGGLIGTTYAPGQIVSSFWDIQTSGQSKSVGGTGKSTSQMKTAKTFIDGGWDFKYVWDIVEHETYPFLRFYPPGDLNYDARVNFRDFAKLAANWSKTCGVSKNPKKPLPKCPLTGDQNYDDTVDGKDLSLLAVQWLDRREQAVVQENAH